MLSPEPRSKAPFSKQEQTALGRLLARYRTQVYSIHFLDCRGVPVQGVLYKWKGGGTLEPDASYVTKGSQVGKRDGHPYSPAEGPLEMIL